MPSHTLDTFYRDLKQKGPAPAYYFHGAEDVLKDEALEKLLDLTVERSLRDFNVDHIQAAQADPGSLADLCSSLPMMAERRVVVVGGVEAWKRKTRSHKAALAYLKRPAPETVVVLIQGSGEQKPDKVLSDAVYAVDFAPLTPDLTRRWLSREAERSGVEFASGAADHLLAAVGGGLGALRAEVAKLSAVAADGPATADLVGRLVGVHRGQTVFDWRNAVMEGRPVEALPLIEPVLNQSTMTGVRMVMTLGTALVGVGVARGHLDGGKRGRALESAAFGSLRTARPYGMPDWRGEAARWAAWAPRWSPARIRAALDHAARADELLKGTRLSSDHAVLTDLTLTLGSGREMTS